MLQNLVGVIALGAGLAGLAGGLWVIYRGRRFHASFERFGEPRTVDALEPGPVSLVGTVEATADTDLVEGPMSGAEGVLVESQVSTGLKRSLVGSGTRRRILDRRAEFSPFELDDGSGRVRVEPPEVTGSEGVIPPSDALAARPTWGLSFDFAEQTGRAGLSWGVPEAERFRELDAPFDLRFGPDDLPPGKRRRYTERVVEPGEELYVAGEARPTPGWDGPDWTVTADDPGTFLLSDSLATREGRDAARRERTWSRRIGYGFGAFAILLGLVVGAAGVAVSPDPVRAVLYLVALVAVLGLGLLLARRGSSSSGGMGFEARSHVVSAGLGLALLGVGGYLLSYVRAETGTVDTGTAWPIYALLVAGAVVLWGAVSAFLYARYGIDLPFRGTMPGQD